MTLPKKAPESMTPIPFIDLKAQQALIRPQIDEVIQRVLDHGHYIMGPEVFELEKELSAFCGAQHVVSCANGTDALGLGLMALDVRPGDAVFVPSFTFAATAEVVAWMGATPVFIDSLSETYNMDACSLEEGIRTAQKAGLRPVGVIPVDLFGLPADYEAIQGIATEHNLWVMADAAQSFGASLRGQKVGTFGDLTTTSFFPAKPLGCYGDGGAIFADRGDLAEKIKSLRVHGQGRDKYDNVAVGMNGRLDTLQAAILLEKLKIFPEELKVRQRTADFYTKHLKDVVRTPDLTEGHISAWAQYTLLLPEHANRVQLMESLKVEGIPTMIYYVKPLHLQKAYASFPTATGGGLVVCEKLSHRVLSLPMSGYVREEDARRVVEGVRHFLA